MENNIKKWYTGVYPNDELGCEINESLTFVRLASEISNVYELLGVDDSIIRERVFARLSELMNVDYDFVYTKWLHG